MTDVTGTDLTLPTGTHAETITGVDSDGAHVEYLIVWRDRPFDLCPRCHETVARVIDAPPVLINPGYVGGQLDQLDLQHGCGCWLTVHWEQADNEIEAVEIAARMAVDLQAEIERARRTMLADLRSNLTDALALLADGVDPDDVTTGSEVHPGVYREGGRWLAWDFDPDGSGDTITADEDDL